MCKCGEGCEEFSCFVGYNCQCCLETYGKRRDCTCSDCRRQLFQDEREEDTARTLHEIAEALNNND